jgi:hypothetical protein
MVPPPVPPGVLKKAQAKKPDDAAPKVEPPLESSGR